MKELARLAWDVLLFKHEAYTRHIVRADALKRGLALLVLVSLVAGALSLAQSVINDLRPVSIETQRMREMEQFTQAPPEVAEQMAEYMRTGIEIGLDIEALPAPLPRPLGRLLLDLGTFLSLPFSRIASWIGYTIWVLLVAKLLGGRATVPQSLGATADTGGFRTGGLSRRDAWLHSHGMVRRHLRQGTGSRQRVQYWPVRGRNGGASHRWRRAGFLRRFDLSHPGGVWRIGL